MASTAARGRLRGALPRAPAVALVAVVLVALVAPPRAFAAAPSAARDATLRVGFGRAPLPVPADGPMGGYGGLVDRTARGLLDPPEARALVFERGDLRVGLVSVDLVIVRPRLRGAIAETVAGLELDALTLVATHTHSGPGGYLEGWLAERITAGDFSPETPGRLAAAASRALEHAAADLAPASLAGGSSRLDLARNRREGAAHETDVPVLRIDFADGRAPVVLFAYGAHPTVLSGRSRDYSADYPGAARAWLEARGYRPVFLPGPLGDQAPGSEADEPADVAGERARREQVGARVGRAALEAAAALEPRPRAALAATEQWADTPPVATRRFCALWWVQPLAGGSLHRFLSERVPVQALRLGDADLVALPAEPASAVGDAIRSRMGERAARFVVAHANDWLGYVVDEPAYRTGGYEACLSFHGPHMARWLVDAAARALAALTEGGTP